MLSGIILGATVYTNSKSGKTWVKALVEGQPNLVHFPVSSLDEEIRDTVRKSPKVLKGTELHWNFLEVGDTMVSTDGEETVVATDNKFVNLNQLMLVHDIEPAMALVAAL